MLGSYSIRFVSIIVMVLAMLPVSCAQNENDIRNGANLPFTADWKYDNTISTRWNMSCGGKDFEMTARGKPDYSIKLKIDGRYVSAEVTDTLKSVFVKDGNALTLHNLSCAKHENKFGYMLMLTGLIHSEDKTQLVAVERTIQVVDNKVSTVNTLDVFPILERGRTLED